MITNSTNLLLAHSCCSLSNNNWTRANPAHIIPSPVHLLDWTDDRFNTSSLLRSVIVDCPSAVRCVSETSCESALLGLRRAPRWAHCRIIKAGVWLDLMACGMHEAGYETIRLTVWWRGWLVSSLLLMQAVICATHTDIQQIANSLSKATKQLKEDKRFSFPFRYVLVV